MYDDLHMGDYIGVVANYAVNESGEEPSQVSLHAHTDITALHDAVIAVAAGGGSK